jgi:hypothetical protein
LKETRFETFFDPWRNIMKKKSPKTEAVSRAPDSPAAGPPHPKVKQSGQKRYVRIDYPMEGELVTSRTYSFRISASPTDRVEVSIDDQEWLPCRMSVGYWWYDWSVFGQGPHSLLARIPSESRRNLTSKPRQFAVVG